MDGVPSRLIPLGNDFYAIVWETDYEKVARFIWHAIWNKNNRCWYAVRNGSKSEGRSGECIRMHRELLGLERGDPRQGDHIKASETLNNCRSNLRLASCGNNKRNMLKPRNNTSGFKGVSKPSRGSGWIVQLQCGDVRINERVHGTKEEAHQRYSELATKYHHEYANDGTNGRVQPIGILA